MLMRVIMEYQTKLRDPRWQKKRLEIMHRDNFRCRLCHASKFTLNIHHITYHGDPWDAPNTELVTLCEHCHGIVKHCVTDEQRRSFNMWLMATTMWAGNFLSDPYDQCVAESYREASSCSINYPPAIVEAAPCASVQ